MNVRFVGRFFGVWAVAVALAWLASSVFVVTTVEAGALGDAAKGKASYDTYCVSCHGATGKGDGPAGAALNPKPRNLADKAYLATLTDEHLLKVITDGGAAIGKSPLMAPWKGTLKDQEIKDVAAYVRSLAK